MIEVQNSTPFHSFDPLATVARLVTEVLTDQKQSQMRSKQASASIHLLSMGEFESVMKVAKEQGVWQLLARHPQLSSRISRYDVVDSMRALGFEEKFKTVFKDTLERLNIAGVEAIIFKGTQLAYSLYPFPAARTRIDTDLFIDAAHLTITRKILKELGFQEGLVSGEDRLSYQVSMTLLDQSHFGRINFDIHWRISNRQRYSKIFNFKELRSSAVSVPQLGHLALGLGAAESLLMSCLHPAMHHYGEAPLIWLVDNVLISKAMTIAEKKHFVSLVFDKQLLEVCLRSLSMTQHFFSCPEVEDLIQKLKTQGTGGMSGTEGKLTTNWLSTFIDDLRCAGSLADSMELIKNVLLPSINYMRSRYHLQKFSDRQIKLLLPLLYFRRAIGGLMKLIFRKI